MLWETRDPLSREYSKDETRNPLEEPRDTRDQNQRRRVYEEGEECSRRYTEELYILHRLTRNEPPPSPGPVGAFRRVLGSKHRKPGAIIPVGSLSCQDYRTGRKRVENARRPKPGGHRSDHH